MDILRIAVSLGSPDEPTAGDNRTCHPDTKGRVVSVPKAPLEPDVRHTVPPTLGCSKEELPAVSTNRSHRPRDLPVAEASIRQLTASVAQETLAATQYQQVAATSEELFKRYIPIPGSRQKKRVYPCMPVASSAWSAEQYKERTAFVVGELKKAVEEDYELRDEGRFIGYDPKMVGTSPETASPTIIVKCKKSILKPLRALFKQRAADRLYCHTDSIAFRLFKERTTPFPPFRLVYIATWAGPLKQCAAEEDLAAFLVSDQTICGSLVQCQGRTATAALSLEVDEIDALLTVGHLWKPDQNDNWESYFDSMDNASTLTMGSDEATLDDAEMVCLDQLWIDDDYDDGLVQPGLANTSESQPSAVSIVATTPVQDESHHLTSSPVEKGQRIKGPIHLHSSSPHLDWGLMQLSRATMETRRSNLIFPKGRSADPVLLQNIANAPRCHAVPVYMLSGVKGIRAGRLLDGFSYLGSRPGQELSRAWTMLLDSTEGLVPGECGSIVVDQETFEVYGHIIGSDSLEQAYVIPLAHTIEQIKVSFNTQHVRLPGACETSGCSMITAVNTFDDQVVTHGMARSSIVGDHDAICSDIVAELVEVDEKWQRHRQVLCDLVGSGLLPPSALRYAWLALDPSDECGDEGIPRACADPTEAEDVISQQIGIPSHEGWYSNQNFSNSTHPGTPPRIQLPWVPYNGQYRFQALVSTASYGTQPIWNTTPLPFSAEVEEYLVNTNAPYRWNANGTVCHVTSLAEHSNSSVSMLGQTEPHGVSQFSVEARRLFTQGSNGGRRTCPLLNEARKLAKRGQDRRTICIKCEGKNSNLVIEGATLCFACSIIGCTASACIPYDSLPGLEQRANQFSETPRSWWGSLAFPEMGRQSNDITAATTTCKWIYQHELYSRWASCSEAVIWIKGKPGSAKLKLLLHVLEDVDTSRAGEGAFILSFPFSGRGTEVQRTLLGLFRSLLHQFQEAPNTLLDVVDTFQQQREIVVQSGEMRHWHQREIRDLFEASVPNAPERRCPLLLDDTLDECSETDYIASLENTVPVHRRQTHGFNSNPPAAIVVAPDVVSRRRPRPLADLDGQIPTDTTKGHDKEPAIRIPPLSPTQSDGTPAAQSFDAPLWPLRHRDEGLARSSALPSAFCSRCLCPSITDPPDIPPAAATSCASDLHPQRAFTLHPSRLPFPSSQSHKNYFAVAMAGEGFGYDYGMTPGVSDADMLNYRRFDSNSTPPLATNFELDESQGSATASSRPGEIELYLQGFDSNYDQSPEELFFPRNEESAFFAPSLLVSQHQLESYVHENTNQRGNQSMGTIAQPMGDFSVPSIHVNAQSSYHEFANDPQGDTQDPGMAFQNNPQGFDPPMMGVDPPGVPSQMVYPAAQGIPANPHLYRQGQYYQQGQYHSAQAQQLQYQQGQGHYQQGQRQQDLGQQAQCQQAQFQQAQFQQAQFQQAQYQQGQYQQYQQGQGQPAQTRPTLSISQRRAPQGRATSPWPGAIPVRQTASIPGQPRIPSQASHSSNPNNTNGPQTGTSPSTYNSYGQFVPPALHTTLGTRSISNKTQSSFTTETDLSVNANLPFPINVNNPAGAGTSAQPGLPTLAANTPDPLAPHETLQGGDEQGQPGPAEPSSSQRTRGHRTGPLSERQREDARNRKENLTVCARCKWKNRGCDCGDEGITRCTTCSSGRSNACVCTRHHFLPLVEQGGATQFTEHHCIYTLVSYESLKSYTISQITTDITDYVSNGCTHIKLYRTAMQAQAECTFDLNACLSLFCHIGTEFARFPTFRDVMDHVVPHESIRARLQTCMPSLDEDCFNLSNFKLNALIDDEGHPSGASFQFQLFSNASASSVGTQNQLSRLSAILFLILGRQIDFEMFSTLSKNLKQKIRDPSTIWGLNYLQQRLFMMRLAYRKCSQSATGEKTEVDSSRLWGLCQHLANVHFCKQEWAVTAMRPLHVPPTIFPQGFTNASFEAWMSDVNAEGGHLGNALQVAS